MIGYFKWHFLQEKNPSLTTDSCSSKISNDSFPLHFTQNMNLENFLFNIRKECFENIYFDLANVLNNWKL